MCEHCALLRHVITKSSTNDCPTYASQHTDDWIPFTCAGCTIFALIHQNTFAERWTELQHNLASAQPTRIHPSLNSQQHDLFASPTNRQDTSSPPLANPKPESTSSVLRTAINLVLSSHNRQAVQQVLANIPSSNLCTTVHISYPDLPLTMKNLHSLHDRTPLTILHTFHHICITAASPLLPCDMTVYVTVNQITYPLTPTRAANTATPNHLHLFINPHNRHPYLLHKHRITDQTTRRLELTTSLPSNASVSRRPQRRPMIRTESHAPDRITTLTFPVATTQHQLSIMTLVTHMEVVGIVTNQNILLQ